METWRGPERRGGSRKVELEHRLDAWLDAKQKTEPDLDDEKIVVWSLHREVEALWDLWKMMEALDWKHLPNAGGLLDQDEALMQDLMTISWRRDRLEARRKQEGTDQAPAVGAPPGDPALFKNRGSQ